MYKFVLLLIKSSDINLAPQVCIIGIFLISKYTDGIGRGEPSLFLEHSGFSTGINYLFIAYFVAGYNLNQCWLAVLKLNLAVKFQLKYTDFH